MVEQRRSSSWSRFSCGKTREEKKRNRDIRLIIRDLQPTCRSKSRYCFNPSLSLSLSLSFFLPFFVSRFGSLFRDCEFSKTREENWWLESVRSTVEIGRMGNRGRRKFDKGVDFLRDASL